mgnify:CR=1 FL=1
MTGVCTTTIVHVYEGTTMKVNPSAQTHDRAWLTFGSATGSIDIFMSYQDMERLCDVLRAELQDQHGEEAKRAG